MQFMLDGVYEFIGPQWFVGFFVSYQTLWLLTARPVENADQSKSALTITECFRSTDLGSLVDEQA